MGVHWKLPPWPFLYKKKTPFRSGAYNGFWGCSHMVPMKLLTLSPEEMACGTLILLRHSHVPLGISFSACAKVSAQCPFPYGLPVPSYPPQISHSSLLWFRDETTHSAFRKNYIFHTFVCMCSTALVYNLKVPHSSRPGTKLALDHKIYWWLKVS